ncbi:MAG: hypothetical protein ACRCYQ_00770, partial [Nocardioides sp.]
MRGSRCLTVVISAVLLVGGTGTSAHADEVRNGGFSESIDGGATFWKAWQDGNYAGSVTTTRADDASWLEVSWKAPNYGHVTRIGKSAEFDSEWATPVDETAGSLPAGFSYTFDPGDPAMDGPVWITLYGWLGDAGRPNHTEFYVVQ